MVPAIFNFEKSQLYSEKLSHKASPRTLMYIFCMARRFISPSGCSTCKLRSSHFAVTGIYLLLGLSTTIDSTVAVGFGYLFVVCSVCVLAEHFSFVDADWVFGRPRRGKVGCSLIYNPISLFDVSIMAWYVSALEY